MIRDIYIKGYASGGGGSVGAKLIKTGCTVSADSGDDGDIQEGRDNSFFLLPSNNPFGHTQRFTGTTGGYYNQALSGYYDVAGVSTTRALAFPNDIFIDWSTYDNTEVLVYYIGNFPLDSYVNAITTFSTASYGGLSGWRCFNVKEAQNLQRFEFGVSNVVNYQPILDSTLNSASQFWTQTSFSATAQRRIQLGGTLGGGISTLTKTDAVSTRGFAVRTCIVTGTTLT